MKKLLWIISCLPLIGTAVALQYLPDQVPMHADLAGNIDRWGSKYEELLFPALILLMALVWTLLIGWYEKKARTAAEEKERAGAASNVRVLGIAAVSLAVMFTVMHGFTLYGAWRTAASGVETLGTDFSKVTVILLGVLMIVLGNFMPKTRRNRLVGLRTKWSLYNDTTWRKSNRFGAAALMGAGVLTVLAGAVLKHASAAWAAACGLILLAVLLSLVYARRVYVQEVHTEKGGS